MIIFARLGAEKVNKAHGFLPDRKLICSWSCKWLRTCLARSAIEKSALRYLWYSGWGNLKAHHVRFPLSKTPIHISKLTLYDLLLSFPSRIHYLEWYSLDVSSFSAIISSYLAILQSLSVNIHLTDWSKHERSVFLGSQTDVRNMSFIPIGSKTLRYEIFAVCLNHQET